MPSNKKINELLTKADKLFERTYTKEELKVLRGYKLALDRIRGELESMFAKADGVPTITELRKFGRLNTLEKKITAIIAEKTKVETNIIASAKRKFLLDSYKNTGFAIEAGSGIVLDFTMLPKESIDFVLSNDLWVSRIKNKDAELLVNVKDEITKVLRENAREEIGAGLAEGKSYSQVAKAIKDRFDISATRAKRITFDQMHAAHMEGRNFGINKALDSAKELGLEARKVWKHYPGASKNPREDHASMDGVPADKDGVFTLPDGTQTTAPGLTGDPAHDQFCHCGMVFEVINLDEI